MSSRAPQARGGARREVLTLAVFAALWLSVWMLLSAAAWAAGGRPRLNPVQYVDPARIVAAVRRHHGLTPWELVGADAVTRPAIFWLVLAAMTSAVIVCGATASARFLQPNGALGPRAGRLRAVSRWARARDVRALRSRRGTPGRFAIGRLGRRHVATERESSVLVIGPTRSGKTTALVVPNLLEWRGPAVVTSTKHELLELTAAHRQSLGPVYVYDPADATGARYGRVTWSPLVGCEDLDRAWMVAAWLCAGLQQGSSRGDNDWAHWAESGKLLIAPLLFAAAITGRTVLDVHAWIHGFDLYTPLALLEDRQRHAALADDASRAMSMLLSVDQRPERERGTVFSTVTRIFAPLNERAVAESARTSRFDPRSFIERNGTLYLCTPRLAPERVSSLFVGLLMTVVTEAYGIADSQRGGRLRSDLGLFLDELANVIPIEDLPSLASQGAGRGVLLMSIVQDLSQLRSRYGDARAHSILNNHVCKVVLPGLSDPETIELLSRLVGRGAVTDVQVNRTGDGKTSRSYALRHDTLASPDALRQLAATSAVVLDRGRPPMLVRLQPWYANRRYRMLTARRFFRAAEHVSRLETGPARALRLSSLTARLFRIPRAQV